MNDTQRLEVVFDRLREIGTTDVEWLIAHTTDLRTVLRLVCAVQRNALCPECRRPGYFLHGGIRLNHNSRCKIGAAFGRLTTYAEGHPVPR